MAIDIKGWFFHKTWQVKQWFFTRWTKPIIERIVERKRYRFDISDPLRNPDQDHIMAMSLAEIRETGGHFVPGEEPAQTPAYDYLSHLVLQLRLLELLQTAESLEEFTDDLNTELTDMQSDFTVYQSLTGKSREELKGLGVE